MAVEQSAQRAAGGRVAGLDVARGVLMAWIISIIHGIFWLRLAPQAPASLLLFEMPPVFMIAGAAYFLAEQNKPSKYFDFLLRRSVRILIPYFAYALVCAAIMIVVRKDDAAEALRTLLAWLNPVRGGAGHAAPMINWHLWFVAPFLIITALMPVLGFIGARAKAPLWLQAIGGALIVLSADMADATRVGGGQTVVFYALWALFGFTLAAHAKRFGVRDYTIVLILSLTALAGLYAWGPASITFDMQRNKFPPNAVFFIFCCAWVSLLLILVRWIDERVLSALAGSPYLKPFMEGGYSIYLWQGVGYAGAALVGRNFGWGPFAVWPLAIILAITLGMLATPLERIRLPRRKPAAAPA